MKLLRLLFLITFSCSIISFNHSPEEEHSWIRINLLGYKPSGIKIAVWCSKINETISSFQLIDSITGKPVLNKKAGKPYGAYGPFQQCYRLDFSDFTKSGIYYLKVGEARSPVFRIDKDVYKGAADFCLRYMRQQR